MESYSEGFKGKKVFLAYEDPYYFNYKRKNEFLKDSNEVSENYSSVANS